MYYVYILKSLKDENLYIGRTKDFNRRFREHNSGKVSSTKSRRPFVLLEKIGTASEMESVELELKYKKGYKREEMKRKYGGVA
ncbi:GIY-YIG nuclease family protein [Candidatus Nomurabacteria bacterium]|nr:GIY-YIG nuclease family protein [Candidatus Nomurabacteria bacterium]